MLDDIEIPDDSTRPRAPTLTITTEQTRPMRSLAAIHEHHRRNMRVLRQVIHDVGKGEQTAIDLQNSLNELNIFDNYRLFGNLCGQHCEIISMHHSIEDQAMFPALRGRNEGLNKVVERLSAEHKVVHQLLVKLSNAAAVLNETPNASQYAIVVEIYETFERLLLSHFGYEEEEIGPALGFYNISI